MIIARGFIEYPEEVVDLFFQCRNCNTKLFYSQLLEEIWNDTINIEEIVEGIHYHWYQASTSDSFDTDQNDGVVTIDYQILDNNCEVNHKLSLLVEFQAYFENDRPGRPYYVESLNDITILGSDTLALHSNSSTIKGFTVLILSLSMFKRWAPLGYDIIILSPFIDLDGCLYPLYEIFRRFSTIDEHNTKFKLYTRNRQLFNKASMNVLFNTWSQDIANQTRTPSIGDCSCYAKDNYSCVHNFVKLMRGNTHRTIGHDKFHAKLFIAMKDEKPIETIITSFNLTLYELNQLETFHISSDIHPSILSFQNMRWKTLYNELKIPEYNVEELADIDFEDDIGFIIDE